MAQEMRSRQQGFSDNNFAIRQNFQTESVPFLISELSSTAFSSYDAEAQVYKVLEWDSHGVGDAIDIPADTLHRALNSPHGEDGNRLLDVALCAKAVTFVCFVNDYRCRTPGLSRITGFPVLDAKRMLGFIVASDVPHCESADPAVFPTCFAMGDPSSAVALSVSIGGACASGVQGEIPCTPEMPLISAGVRADRAFPVSYVDPLGNVAWQGYFNASKPLSRSQGAGANVLANAEAAAKFVRKRWCDGAHAALPDTAKKGKKSAR